MGRGFADVSNADGLQFEDYIPESANGDSTVSDD